MYTEGISEISTCVEVAPRKFRVLSGMVTVPLSLFDSSGIIAPPSNQYVNDLALNK
jgi:hypothetical protein